MILKIFIAGVLSFLFPGLGQLYNQQKFKGALFILLGILFIYLNFFGLRLPLILFRCIAAAEAAYFANKILKSGNNEGFLKPKRAIIELTISIILVCVLTFVPYRLLIKPATGHFSQQSDVKSEEEIKIAEEKMINYLEEKYQIKFLITEKTLYIPELGKYDYVISPQDQSFYFGGNYYENKNKFEDNYLNGLWGEEFDKEVKLLSESLFKNIWKYSAGVWVDEEIKEREINPLNIPNYKQLREKYPNGYDQKFQLYVFENMNEANKMEKLKKVYELVQWIKSNEINKIQFRVCFYDEKLLKDQGDQISPNINNRKFLQYEVAISSNGFLKINSLEDLLEFTKKVN